MEQDPWIRHPPSPTRLSDASGRHEGRRSDTPEKVPVSVSARLFRFFFLLGSLKPRLQPWL